jgi:hypothetical protein
MNFGGTSFPPFGFQTFDAILCSCVTFLFLVVFALPGRSQGALSVGLIPVHSDLHADVILH